MKKLVYEQPRLIILNEVTYGNCHAGSSAKGTCRTGFTPMNNVCGMGHSTTNCTVGNAAGLHLSVPNDILNE